MTNHNDTVRTFEVEGMTCAHCEASVREEVEELAGVDSAHADHTTGLLVVRGTKIDDGAIRAAVQAAGYDIDKDATRR
jgi:copper chaperone CopZ